ncbi:hypothetical protein Tco_1132813 [Tanacetum coccineum]|uniref:Reverse transcriptase domain-containing protein n=1 Tax=Tanacetum coccineum TaxID=301880 RepID=A0ABQ5JD02_9ASTR
MDLESFSLVGVTVFLYLYSGSVEIWKLRLSIQILGGDQLLVILCGFGTKSLEFGISFLSMTISGAASYAFSDSLLLTPLCCDDIHDVTPRVSALAGCDRLVGLASEYTDDILAYSNSEGGTKVSFEVSVESLMNEKPDAKFSKSNVVGDALSRKERVKSRRVRGMILAAQRNVMDEARASRYLVHLGADKTYYNLGYMIGSHCAPFEALYGRKCRSPVLWAEIKESSLTGLEVVQETTDKEVLIKEKPKAVRDRQKSYADNRRKPLEFEVGDRVLLRVSPCKGICLADANLHVPLNEIKVDKTLRFVEEPVEIMDREIRS